MDLTLNFTSSIGSVLGNTHKKLHYNNQDAYNYFQSKDLIIGVVADGCGGGACNEVGAKLIVDFLVNYCKKNYTNNPFEINTLKSSILSFLKNIVSNQQTDDELYFIENFLFFTLFGFVITPELTYIFHSGDGMYIINNEIHIVEQDNRPNYISKNLISGNFDFEIKELKTDNIDKILISTDGLIHLNEYLNKNGQLENISSISDLFNQSVLFDDISSLPKLLLDFAIKYEILRDDTTLIMLKRTIYNAE